VVPAGYSGTPLAKKLVLRAGAELVLLGAPEGWEVPEMPEATIVRHEPKPGKGRVLPGAPAPTIIAFFRQAAALPGAMSFLAPRIFPDGAIWAAWPRRAGGHQSDITEELIRQSALGLGLVDVKVAAMDQDWSGLRLVWRKANRK
jgi:hypothetical protein